MKLKNIFLSLLIVVLCHVSYAIATDSLQTQSFIQKYYKLLIAQGASPYLSVLVESINEKEYQILKNDFDFLLSKQGSEPVFSNLKEEQVLRAVERVIFAIEMLLLHGKIDPSQVTLLCVTGRSASLYQYGQRTGGRFIQGHQILPLDVSRSLLRASANDLEISNGFQSYLKTLVSDALKNNKPILILDTVESGYTLQTLAMYLEKIKLSTKSSSLIFPVGIQEEGRIKPHYYFPIMHDSVETYLKDPYFKLPVKSDKNSKLSDTEKKLHLQVSERPFLQIAPLSNQALQTELIRWGRGLGHESYTTLQDGRPSFNSYFKISEDIKNFENLESFLNVYEVSEFQLDFLIRRLRVLIKMKESLEFVKKYNVLSILENVKNHDKQFHLNYLTHEPSFYKVRDAFIPQVYDSDDPKQEPLLNPIMEYLSSLENFTNYFQFLIDQNDAYLEKEGKNLQFISSQMYFIWNNYFKFHNIHIDRLPDVVKNARKCHELFAPYPNKNR